MIKIKGLNKNILIYALYIFSFSLPLGQKLSTIVIILWLVFSIVFIRFKKRIFSKELLYLPILYIIYIYSLMYSEIFSFKYFEQKASLVAFPVIFYLNYLNYQNKHLKKALKFFVSGCVFASVSCYLVAIYKSFYLKNSVLFFKPQVDSSLQFLESSIKGGNYFFGTHFSIFHQTVYFAMFLCFAISIILFYKNIFNKKILKIIITLFLSLVVIQISSRAGIATLLLIYLFFCYKKFNTKKFAFASGFFLLILIPLIVILNPRVNNLVKNFVQKGVSFHNEDNSSLSLRLMTWDASVQIIKKNPILGVGVSDAYNELKIIYKKERYVTPYLQRLNSHNQYLQFMVECGLLALLIFVIQLIFLTKIKILNPNFKNIIITFLIIIIFNSFFESIFNHYSGISFYCFLFCLFTFYSLNINLKSELKK